MGGRRRLPTGMRGLPDDLRDAARAWAEQTAQEQGLGPTVAGGDVLHRVVVLLDGKRSGAPDRRQTGGVELVVAPPGGSDDEVV
jgi:hypothetical protein